ncbi:MAG: DUF1688 family protein [Alphaproteobacteria bacterium]|nr:DUF1688 family protein [Alphaproteobacteria bacterium]
MSGRDEAEAARWLLTAGAVRERARQLLGLADAGRLPHLTLHRDRLPDVVDEVLATTLADYPDLDVPYHSRWRHFAVGGRDRWQVLAASVAVDAHEKARIGFDLAVTSVLLDAGAGPDWRYCEPATGATYTRSEGLAVASFDLFAAGAFSSDPGRPLRADAAGLSRFDAARLAVGCQVVAENPMIGLEGRAQLLRSLGRALMASPALFGADARIGGLVDVLESRASGGRLPATAILDAVLAGLGPVWPGRLSLAGRPLGDTWRHRLAASADAADGLVPFHKLSQWLTYSLVEPLEGLGIVVTDLDALTGLPEYRNGGLFLDFGVLAWRDSDLARRRLKPEDEPVVEWRALTVALLDEVAAAMRVRLGLDAERLPLAKVLQGGTWTAGRRIAARLRPGGGPPVLLDSDGTVF